MNPFGSALSEMNFENFTTNVSSGKNVQAKCEKQWKRMKAGYFYNKAAELDIRKHPSGPQLLLSGIEKCVKHKYNSFNTALHQFKRPLISNLGQLQKNMLIWAKLWYRWIITYTTIMILITVYLNGMERNDQYTTINAKSRETNGVSKCSELPCKCMLVTKTSLLLSHIVSSSVKKRGTISRCVTFSIFRCEMMSLTYGESL